jgi:hypothetical protein
VRRQKTGARSAVFSKYSKSEVECLHKMVKGNEEGRCHGIGSGLTINLAHHNLSASLKKNLMLMFEELGFEVCADCLKLVAYREWKIDFRAFLCRTDESVGNRISVLHAQRQGQGAEQGIVALRPASETAGIGLGGSSSRPDGRNAAQRAASDSPASVAHVGHPRKCGRR